MGMTMFLLIIVNIAIIGLTIVKDPYTMIVGLLISGTLTIGKLCSDIVIINKENKIRNSRIKEIIETLFKMENELDKDLTKENKNTTPHNLNSQIDYSKLKEIEQQEEELKKIEQQKEELKKMKQQILNAKQESTYSLKHKEII